MMIYDLLFISLSILLLISSMKISNKKLNIIIQVILLSLVSGLRYQETIGSDFNAYKTIFENSIYGVNTEFLYWVLNFLVRKFTDNFNIFLLIVSTIINFIIVFVIHKLSKMPNISVLIYMILGGYFTSYNITRQYITVAIYWLIIYLLINNKSKQVIIATIIGSLFHQSLLIVVVSTILISRLIKNINKKKVITLIIIFSTLFILEPILRKFFTLVIYSGYSNLGNFNYGANITIYILELFIITVILLNNDKTISSYNEVDKILIFNMLMSYVFVVLSLKVVLYARFVCYFSIYKVILIPNIISYSHKKIRPLLIYSLLIFLILYYVFIVRSDISMYKSYISDFILR